MKRLVFLLFVSSIFMHSINAQVGINTPVVDDNLMLHIKEKENTLTGVKFPTYLTLTKKSDIILNWKPERLDALSGTLIYLKEDSTFYYLSKIGWNALNPWKSDKPLASSKNISGTYQTTIKDNVIIKNNLDVQGKISGFGTIPIGGIIMWSGKTVDLESTGFVLCNGGYYDPKKNEISSIDGNGFIKIPDLQGRFVVGYDDKDTRYDINNTGGEDSLKLKSNHLPAHKHGPGTMHITSSGNHSHTYRYHAIGKKGKAKSDGFYRVEKGLTTSNTGTSNHTHPIGSFAGITEYGGGAMEVINHPAKYRDDLTDCEKVAYIISYRTNKSSGTGTTTLTSASAEEDFSDDDYDIEERKLRITEDLLPTSPRDSQNYPPIPLPSQYSSFGLPDDASSVWIYKNPKYYKLKHGRCYEPEWVETRPLNNTRINNLPPFYTLAYIIRVK